MSGRIQDTSTGRFRNRFRQGGGSSTFEDAYARVYVGDGSGDAGVGSLSGADLAPLLTTGVSEDAMVMTPALEVSSWL